MSFVTPGQYAAKVIGEKLATVPAGPTSGPAWKELKQKMMENVRRCIRTDVDVFAHRATWGEATRQADGEIVRVVIQPEEGIRVPVLLVRLGDGAACRPGTAARRPRNERGGPP